MLKSLITGLLALLTAFGLHHSAITATSVSRSPYADNGLTQTAASAAATNEAPSTTTPSFQDLSSSAQTTEPSTSSAGSGGSQSAQQLINPIAHASRQSVALDPLTDYVTQADLASVTAALAAKFASEIAALANPAVASIPQSVAAGGNRFVPYAAASNIGQLSNVTISNPTFTDLSASEIPDLSGKYLSLDGGTVSGSTTFRSVSVGPSGNFIAPFSVTGNTSSAIVATTAATGDGSVVIKGNYAYSVDSGNSTFSITDISAPSTPTVLSTTVVDGGSSQCEMGISVLGRYAYVVLDCSSDLSIYDISNPKNPVLISNTGGYNFPTALAVQGKFAYVARDPFYITEISDPQHPAVVFDQSASSFTAGYQINSAVLAGRYLYTVGTSPGGPGTNSLAVQVIDVTNAASPALVSTIAIGHWSSYSSTFDQVTIQGRYLYTISNDPNELVVVDVSNPTSPTVAGSLTLGGTPSAIRVQGRYAYIAQSNGVGVYDISSAASPTYLGLLTTTDTTDLGISGRYAVTSAGEVLDLGGAYIQSLEAGDLSVGTLSVTQLSSFLDGADFLGGLNVGAPGFYSSGPVGISSEGGGSSVLSVTAATTSQSTGKTAAFSTEAITNNATSSAASLIKSGLNIISEGSWTGTAAKNIGLYISSVSGGTNNYDAIFNGGGNVGIGSTNPYSRLQVTGPDTASSTSLFALVNSASTTVFSVFDGGNAELSGSLSQSSDQRLKTNVQSLDASSSLSSLEQLNPVSYLRIDQPGTGENLGFLAQQVEGIFPELVSTSSPTALTPDGTLTLNYTGLIAPIVSAIQNIAQELAALESSVAGFADNFVSRQITATNTLCVDKADGTAVCITGDQLAILLASRGGLSSGEADGGSDAAATSTPDTPPIIEVNGDNPATVDVGTSYSDLGATITGPEQDLDLGIDASVDGGATTTPEAIIVDTSEAGTHAILYCVTDQSGLTACATRTLNVLAPADNNDASTSEATSTSATATP